MRYQIDGKVRRIISDNASSMKKAFELSLTIENIKDKLPGESKDQLSKRLVINSTIAKVSKVARTLRSSTTASKFLRKKNVYVLTKNQR